jgi:hypothetical protein
MTTKEEQFFFDWDISKLESTAVVGSFTDVVTRVYWTLWGSDEHGNRAPLYGETEISTADLEAGVPQSAWVPYQQLTKENVEGILEDQLGEDEIARLTDNLKIQLEQLRETKVTTAPPPWLG